MSLPLLDQLSSSITPQLAGYAAKFFGESPNRVEQAIAAALPAILSGIAGATHIPSSLATVSRLVNDPVNDGSLLQHLPALYQGTMTGSPVYRLGTQLLQGIFGSKLSHVTHTVAVLSGINPASSALLVSTLAPHVLSVLGERQRANAEAGPTGLAHLLNRESSSIAAALPPSLHEVFGAPGITRAATAVSASRNKAAAATTSAATSARTASRATSAPLLKPDATAARRGFGPWVIFPLSFILGAGVISLAALNSSKPVETSPGPVAATPSAAPAGPKVADASAVETKTVAEAPPVAAPAAKPPVEKTLETKQTPPAKNGDAKSTETKTETKSATATKPAATSPLVPPSATAGVTNYYGVTPSVAEAPARANPEYKPAAAVTAAVTAPAIAKPAPAADTPPPAPLPGVTTFFGPGKPVAEMAAIANADYTPAPAASGAPSVTETPSTSAPQTQIEPRLPGVTTFFGASPLPPESPAKPNPDYKPAAPPIVAAAAVVPAAPPVPRLPGITTFFGSTVTPAEAAARANPDYKPSVAAVIPAAPVEAPTATPAAAAPVAAAGLQPCRDEVANAVKSGSVLFKSAKADLKSSSIATLDRIAAAFKSCPQSRLRVEGHTDNTGLAEMNLILSQARAQTVTDYLASKGIGATRMTPTGFGFSRPVMPNTNAVNKALNRRIEFIVDAQ